MSTFGCFLASFRLLFCAFLCGLLTPVRAVEFTVEESENGRIQHLHRIRHARASKSQFSPYKSAASSLRNPASSNGLEAFSLNCPHVVDANNAQVRIEVTWTLNDTIWLKIEDGEKRIVNKLTTFNKRTVAGKTVLRVLLNNGRYFFDYDELTGDFAMEIRPVQVFEDVGVWQCHVTVHQMGNTHTLTSRSRVKIPKGLEVGDFPPPRSIYNPRDIYETFPAMKALIEMKRQETQTTREHNFPAKISSFTRNDKELVQINRDEHKRRATVVFDRQQPRVMASRHAQHAIDYEMSMADDPYLSPRSRARSTFHYGNGKGGSQSYLVSLIFSLFTIMFIGNYCC